MSPKLITVWSRSIPQRCEPVVAKSLENTRDKEVCIVSSTSTTCYKFTIHVAVIHSKLALLLLGRDASNADKLSLELEHRVGRDRSHTPSAVSPLRLNDQSPLLARAHVQKSLVPTLDHLSFANVERQGLATIVGCIEFGAIGLEGTAVVDVDFVA